MSGLSYAGAAPFAQFASGGNNGGDENTVDVHLLAKLGEHELATDYLDVMQRYRSVMSTHKQRRAVELQAKLDELIVIARQKRAAFDQANDDALNAANAHIAAEQAAEQYRRKASNLRHDIANSRELLTTAEKAQRQAKLRELENQLQQAQLAESEVFTRVRNRKLEASWALEEAKAADAAARDVEAQIAALTGEKNGSSVRFSTSNGFQV